MQIVCVDALKVSHDKDKAFFRNKWEYLHGMVIEEVRRRDVHKSNCMDILIKCCPNASVEQHISMTDWLWGFLQLVTASVLHLLHMHDSCCMYCQIPCELWHSLMAVILAYHLLLRGLNEILCCLCEHATADVDLYG